MWFWTAYPISCVALFALSSQLRITHKVITFHAKLLMNTIGLSRYTRGIVCRYINVYLCGQIYVETVYLPHPIWVRKNKTMPTINLQRRVYNLEVCILSTKWYKCDLILSFIIYEDYYVPYRAPILRYTQASCSRHHQSSATNMWLTNDSRAKYRPLRLDRTGWIKGWCCLLHMLVHQHY